MCPSPSWFHYPDRRLLAGALGLLWSVLAGGCATTTAPPAPDSIEEVSATPEPETPEYIPVVRYGRYTLVELAPTAAQRDLLLQTIDVSTPEYARATVGDGLRHVLKRSGYGLCQTAHVVSELYALPLPAAHLHLGPMTLRDALLTLAGPVWKLHADDRARQICFERPGDSVAGEPASEPSAAKAVQAFPLEPSVSGDQP
ncbi:PilL N-terminal domain-containing protein [Pseudomonas syringae]|uniref:PFGI-1 class ICE element type IV pilus protein PilL2 n=1 Tax=Pseudomonas syringae TaxID=317 RepID=UPI000CDA21EB|nr:PilL N-terminal domain-containing protein [Pseudomonas syringae]POR69935.1 integrating conjugative element protein pill, pfgi-1 [Pseudomonas syringae pv. syringae]POR78586.1 integrating conjugative element protein pill, pfgi-1 [Pseudomonas syringae pv. syringae]